MVIKELEHNERKVMVKASPLVRSLNSYFEQWRPTLAIKLNDEVTNIKTGTPPKMRDFRLKPQYNNEESL